MPDPYRNFRFLVEMDGIVQAGFSECSGLASNIEVIEYREGGDPSTVSKMPGKMSYPDITLKWGTTDSRELFDWHQQVVSGTIPLPRKNGSIILQDDSGAEKVRWNFFRAWPSKWAGPTFTAKGNDVSIETLTLSCERVERAS